MKMSAIRKSSLSIFMGGIFLLGSIPFGITQAEDRYLYRYKMGAPTQSSEDTTFTIPEARGVFPASFAFSPNTTFDVSSPTELSASQLTLLVTPELEPVGVLPVTVFPGQEYKVIAAAPDGYGKQNTISFTVGDRKGKWTIASQLVDVTPDMFYLNDNPFIPGTQFASQISVVPNGYEATTDLFITNDPNSAYAGKPSALDASRAAISVDGGPWSAQATISPRQSLRVRALSANFGSAAPYYIAVVGENNGGVVGMVNFTTLPASYLPTVQNPTYTVNVRAGTSAISEAIIPTDFNAPLSIRIGEPSYPGTSAQVSVDGGTWGSSAVIYPGQSYRLKYDVPSDAFDGIRQSLSIPYSVGNRANLMWVIGS
jgi:hypothetical protein